MVLGAFKTRKLFIPEKTLQTWVSKSKLAVSLSSSSSSSSSSSCVHDWDLLEKTLGKLGLQLNKEAPKSKERPSGLAWERGTHIIPGDDISNVELVLCRQSTGENHPCTYGMVSPFFFLLLTHCHSFIDTFFVLVSWGKGFWIPGFA